MRLVHNDQKLIREIINQRIRWDSRLQSCQMSRIVLNTAAKSRFAQHFNIKIRAFRDTLCLDQLIFPFKITHPLFHLFFNFNRGLIDFLLRNNIMRCRKYCTVLQSALDLTGQHIDFCDPVNFISKKLHTHRRIRIVCRKNLQHITTHTKRTTMKIHVISHILNINELADHIIPVSLHARSQRNHHVLIIHRTSQTIDTRNTGYDDDVAALRQCSGGR